MFVWAVDNGERKFSHVKDAYDFHGPLFLCFITSTCKSPALKEQLLYLVNEQFSCVENNGLFADCSIRAMNTKMQEQNEKSFDSATKNRAYRINQVFEKVDQSRTSSNISSINWEPYLTNTFIDEQGDTLLHKLAQLCDQNNTEDLIALIKMIEDRFGFGRIPASFDNVNGSKTNGQSVFVKGFPGFMLSGSIKNNAGQTALDIVNGKLQEGTYMGMFLSSSCIPCESLQRELKELLKLEKSTQNAALFIKETK